MLPLLGLGLPWSILSTYVVSNDLVSGDAAFWALCIWPALVNLALRSAPRGSSRPGRRGPATDNRMYVSTTGAGRP